METRSRLWALLEAEVVRQVAYVAVSLILGLVTLLLLDWLMQPRNVIASASLVVQGSSIDVGYLSDGKLETEVQVRRSTNIEVTLDRKRMVQEFRAPGRGGLRLQVRAFDDRGKLQMLGQSSNRVVRWRTRPVQVLRITLSVPAATASVQELDLR